MDDPRWDRIKLWQPVRLVFQAAADLFKEADRLRAAAEAEAAGPSPVPARGKLPPPPGAPDAYRRRRGALRELIEGIDPVFTDHLAPWETHLCKVAIVSFIDERERVALGTRADAWHLPLFQTELLGIDDGGDRTFAQIHELRARADVNDLVFEIHLLCLRAGLVGRHASRRHELDRIEGLIVERLRRHPPRRAAAAPEAPPPTGPRIGFVQFPVRYYLGVAAVVVAAFLGLRIVSGREVARSSLADYCHYRDEGP